MNRHLLPLLIVACLTGVSRAELLSNRGFESGDFSNWSVFGPDWRMGVGDDAHTGTHGAVNDVRPWHDPGENWRGIHQEVPVTAGETYWASVFIRAVNNESSSSWLELQWLDDDGGVIRQDGTTPVTSDQPFQLETLPWLAAPAGAVTASVRGVVHMPEPPASEADFHVFDDFSLVHIPAGALKNPGFETGGTDEWMLFGPGWRTGTGGDARSGVFGAVNDVLDSQSPEEQWRGLLQNVPVSPDTRYVFSAYIRTLNLESSRSFLEVRWLNEESGLISQVQSEPVVADQPFTLVQIPNLVPPPDAVMASVRAIVHMESRPEGGADFHIFDDLCFRPQIPLAILPSGDGGWNIQWSEEGVGYLVESTPNLMAPSWARIHQAPAPLPGGNRGIADPAADPQSYYRLVKP